MKRFCFFVLFFLVLAFGSLSYAESPHLIVNNDVAKAMVESALINGFNPYKDAKSMLDNALLNGYDYCEVEANKKSGSFTILVALDGFASAVESLETNESEEAKNALMELSSSDY